jgi:hypothetical protein
MDHPIRPGLGFSGVEICTAPHLSRVNCTGAQPIVLTELADPYRLGSLLVPEREFRRIREPGVNPGLSTQRYLRTTLARMH